jgi:hypothetical protein
MLSWMGRTGTWPLAAVAVGAALLLPAPAAAPALDGPVEEVRGPYTSINFDLPANNGLRAHLQAGSDGDVKLEFFRKGRRAVYEVVGKVGADGMRARFGKIGLIDVDFTPTRTIHENDAPKRCEGEPRTRKEGVFAGTIEFKGERGFVRIDAQQGKGTLLDIPEWRCTIPDGPIPVEPTPPTVSASASDREDEEETATLFAYSRESGCVFGVWAAQGDGGRRVTAIFGGTFEEREGMAIERITFARGRAGAFVFDHEAGTARVDPPQPFGGRGFFKRRPGRRNLWRSTIRFPLLGAGTVSVRGRGAVARLSRELPVD